MIVRKVLQWEWVPIEWNKHKVISKRPELKETNKNMKLENQSNLFTSQLSMKNNNSLMLKIVHQRGLTDSWKE